MPHYFSRPLFTTNKIFRFNLRYLITLECLTTAKQSVFISLYIINTPPEGWKPVPCQREECQSSGEAAESIKLCLDHRVAVSQQGNNENGPLLVVCAGCADEIKRIDPPANLTANGNQQQPVEPLVELLLPMLQVAATCDNTVITDD